MSQTFAPSFTAAKLYRKTSAKGGTYYVGRTRLPRTATKFGR
jgi:hypothetical protein